MNKSEIKINYDFQPEVYVNDSGINVIENITDYLNQEIERLDNITIVLDCYLGINQKKLNDFVNGLNVSQFIDLNQYLKTDEEIENDFSKFLTNHPVNGKFAIGEVYDFYKQETAIKINQMLDQPTVIFGLGASKILKGDIQIIVNTTRDLAMDNLLNRNQYMTEKRLNFLDFHLFDMHKRYQLNEMDYVIDFTSEIKKMVSIKDYKSIIQYLLSQPFRTTPLFEENIWGGGQWFKNRLGADIKDSNVSFIISSILEQQSVLTSVNHKQLVIPGIDIIALSPITLLGEKIFYTYGYRTPMHMILVDTFGGQHSSLQVHPTASYNQDFMNYPYGHHEGYYIVETNKDSSVYLGINDEYTVKEFTDSLEQAQTIGEYDANVYVNQIPVEKFDYFYLPGGVVHAFGAETVCLEIDASSTTTFKLWDWGRLGADGKQRPIDIELAKKVIQEKFTNSWSKENLFFRENNYRKGTGNHSLRIGTMEYCPMEVEKHWFNDRVRIKSTNQIMVIALVEGEEVVIKSPTQAFADFELHYMETVYISNQIDEIDVISNNSERVAIVQVTKEK